MDEDQALNKERMRNSAEALHNVDSSARHGACEEMERRWGLGDRPRSVAVLPSMYSGSAARGPIQREVVNHGRLRGTDPGKDRTTVHGSRIGTA